MALEVDDILVRELGAELVSRLAPEELPLFDSMVARAAQPTGRKRAAKDQVLGFGVTEAVVLMTPVLLQFSQGFWETLLKQAGDAVADQILRHLPERFRKADKDEQAGKASKPGKDAVAAAPRQASADPAGLPAPGLTLAVAQRVRETALQQATRLGLDADQSRLLADAVVGTLIVPAA